MLLHVKKLIFLTSILFSILTISVYVLFLYNIFFILYLDIPRESPVVIFVFKANLLFYIHFI